jgi:CheY-like chemotaxis protein
MAARHGLKGKPEKAQHFISVFLFKINSMTSNREAEILLVEDNPTDAELAIRALRKGKVSDRIIHLTNGAEALEFLFGDPAGPPANLRLILLDLKMPKVDGFEVLDRIRASSLTKNIPVVVLTSSAQDIDVNRCYQLGVSSYVVKPIEYENLNRAFIQIGLYWLGLNRPPGL